MDVNTKTNYDNIIEPIDAVFDSDWIKMTFNIPDKEIVRGDEYSKWVRKNRYVSSADIKYTTTAPGMNLAVNPKPQFTRYCDIRSKGKFKERDDVTIYSKDSKSFSHPTGLGMGRYYSEAIDDNEQRIYLRFGVPKYLPLLFWIQKAFDVDKATLQNRGVITSTFLKAIGVVSYFFAINAAPLTALGMFLFNVYVQNTRFYSVKDTMYVYWGTVENILNQIVARRTMLPTVFQDYTMRLDGQMGTERKVNTQFIQQLNELIPDIIDKETGRISVYAIALRGQTVFNKIKLKDIEENENNTLSKDFTNYPETGNTSHDTYFTNRQGKENFFTAYIFKNAAELLIPEKDKTSEKPSRVYEFDDVTTDQNGEIIDLKVNEQDPNDSLENRIRNNAQNKKKTWDNFKSYFLAELSEGAAFAVFNVEYTGSIGESFSNSFGANPIESVFNSLSAKSRTLTDIVSSATSLPVVGDALKLAADAGAQILSNASFGVANPLLALAYGVNVSMPKVWESSSATLPRSSYKIKLISPYGNPYSQLFNIYLPLSMILAGSLPRSTGNSSYTYPFFCQLFDRGRTSINLGMIESVSITRGTSNLAFTKAGHPTAIDVDISIANLDEVVTVDVMSSGVISKFSDNFNLDFSDKPFDSYLNALTAVDVYTQIYRIPNIRLKLAEKYMNIKAIFSDTAAQAAFAGNTIDTITFGLTKNVLGDSEKALQDLMNK
jgi:hypothetical protein